MSTDGQSVDAQIAALKKHGAEKVFREVASGAKTDRAQLRRVISQLAAGDVLSGRPTGYTLSSEPQFIRSLSVSSRNSLSNTIRQYRHVKVKANCLQAILEQNASV